jgi:hypothetical protein
VCSLLLDDVVPWFAAECLILAFGVSRDDGVPWVAAECLILAFGVLWG